jgi:predicted PhzF superfamily epimerase YddE/YHI9
MQLYQVDAFTREPFKGNPAAVCLLEKAMPDAWMQNLAKEMNLSETAFLLQQENGWSLRWFTPTVEVDLCGHATLATAHMMYESGLLVQNQTAAFFTRSGWLQAAWRPDGIELNFPATPPQPSQPPPGLLDALQVNPLYVGRSQFDYLVQVASEEEVRNLLPDFSRLRWVTSRGIMVTSQGREYDFVSRFFAPALGIDEDPVTGSAHCCLGPFWSRILAKNSLTALQASPRSGTLTVIVDEDRVRLIGQAVTVFKAELLI